MKTLNYIRYVFTHGLPETEIFEVRIEGGNGGSNVNRKETLFQESKDERQTCWSGKEPPRLKCEKYDRYGILVKKGHFVRVSRTCSWGFFFQVQRLTHSCDKLDLYF